MNDDWIEAQKYLHNAVNRIDPSWERHKQFLGTFPEPREPKCPKCGEYFLLRETPGLPPRLVCYNGHRRSPTSEELARIKGDGLNHS